MPTLQRTTRRYMAGLAVLVLPLFMTGCDGDPVQTVAATDVTVEAGSSAPVPAAGSRAFAVQVAAEGGGPAAGVVVSWSVVSGGGALSGTTSTTDSQGRAQITWTSDGAAGNVELRATAPGVGPVTIAFTVTPGSPVGISLSPSEIEFNTVGQQLAVDAVLRDEFGNGIPLDIQFSTDDSEIATISQGGVLRAEGNGQTTVRASFAGHQALATVVVSLTAARLEASPGAHTLTAIGESVQTGLLAFDAADNPFPLDLAQVQWLTMDGQVAAVNAAGRVEAVGVGATTVKAYFQAVAVEVPVTVSPQVARLLIAPRTLAFTSIGATETLKATARDRNGHDVVIVAGALSWASTDESVVTVEGGMVTAVGPGEAEVSVLLNGVSASVFVTVEQVVGSVSLSAYHVGFSSLGSTRTLHAQVFDELGNRIEGLGADDITWSSSDHAVFTVSAMGVLTPVSSGIALLTVSAGGVEVLASVSVSQSVASLAANPSSVIFHALADTATVSATAFDANGNEIPGTHAGLRWTSSDTTVATVSATGVVRAEAVGIASVTMSLNGLTTSSEIIVDQAVYQVRVLPQNLELEALGETYWLSARAYDSGGSVIPAKNLSFAWASTSPGVATISPDGLVAATGPGLARISATLGGTEGSARVAASIDPHAITVNRTGAGTGTVTSTTHGALSGGIECGAVCSREFYNGASVTLTAEAHEGATFAGWSGAGCSGTSTCVIDVSAATSVTATFNVPSMPFIATLVPHPPIGLYGMPRTAGFEFNVASSIEVLELRAWFEGSHTVWIRDVTGGTTVASAIVSSNNASWGGTALADPVILVPGRTYVLATWHPGVRVRSDVAQPAQLGGITMLRNCFVLANVPNPCAPGATVRYDAILGLIDFVFRAVPTADPG